MTTRLRHALDSYAREVSRLSTAESTTEGTYYPAIKSMIEAALADLELRLEVRASTSEARRVGGRDAPDFAVYDGTGGFVMLYVEAKTPDADIRELAMSRDRNDQIGRYLAAVGAVLLCNVREFAVVTAATRRTNRSVRPEDRRLGDVVELWPTAARMRSGARIPDDRGTELGALIEDAITRHTPIASPETLARVLARQARRAAAALPAAFTDAVRSLQDDLASTLGIEAHGPEGEHFFRSSLIQTVYYGLFAGWLLHRTSEWRAQGVDEYDWRRTGEYLRIPFLAGLFHEIQNPVRLRELGLRGHLEAAANTLARVDVGEFFRRLRPDMADEDNYSSAIVYFYEPFLAAFDPGLREELGVWYTPPEIVRYQVRQVDRLLREELGCLRGLADESVTVLDPACGTGAYLLETLRCIAETLRSEGIGAELAATLRAAVQRRVFGFEILTAPFVVAHLQLYLTLAALGAAPDETHRAGVFLTNALTGWYEAPHGTLHFPELQQERDAAQRVKRDARIVVVLGNPPYYRYAGVPIREEQPLVDPYKGIHRDDRGRQAGQTDLWARWGIRKQLLDDLYVRFFRLGEVLVSRADYGIVSYISNSSFLIGRSHPIMRESLLSSFDAVWIDNLNGDKYKTGKIIPEGEPGAGSVDASVFVMDGRGGIQVGTCISTWLRRRQHSNAPSDTIVHVRDFWGSAKLKREALVQSLDIAQHSPADRAAAAIRPQGPRPYRAFPTSSARRWKLLPYETGGGYEEWPSVEQLFGLRSAGVNANRGLDHSVIDIDHDSLVERMRLYFSTASDEEVFEAAPELGRKYAGYVSATVRDRLRKASQYDISKIVAYQLFPLDLRWLYYETESHLLNRPRPEIAANLADNEFFVLVNESRRTSETKPLISRVAFDLHLFDVGAQGFPAERSERVETALDIGTPSYVRSANLAASVWAALSARWGLAGTLYDDRAKTLIRQLFRVAIAIGHSPAFQRDFSGSLAHDWLHVPIPRAYEVFVEIALLGDHIATLLDPTADQRRLQDLMRSLLDGDAARLAVVSTDDGGPADENDLRVEVAHFAAAPGGWRPRMPQAAEPWRDEWGEFTGDLALNDRVFLRHVPERAWRYELGGYQVIKKWLGYREARRRDGRPLSWAEKDHLRSMVQRLSALVLLEASLDVAYERAAGDAFTAAELGFE